MQIVPASPAVWPAIVELMQGVPDGRWCWCQFWRKPGANWSNTTPDENRADLRALLDRDGPAPGLVAIQDGKAVGWVGLGPREDFPRLGRSRTLPQLPGEDVWTVNCFVVARAVRKSGIAGQLLEAALMYAKAHGAKIVEGYPVKIDGARIPSASVYTGTAGMFERAGFDVAAPTTSKASSGTPRVVMRRTP